MLDTDKVLKSCKAARSNLFKEDMLQFLPEPQSRLQKGLSDYIKIFEEAANGHFMNRELLRDAANQAMWLASTDMARALQVPFPTEWEAFQALKPAATQFLDYN